MPELPEVETVRRGLEPVLRGRVLAQVEQFRADLRWPLPERFATRLEGRRVEAAGRRGKFLLIGLDAASTGPETWVVHLGLSGRILVAASVTVAAGAPIGAFHHAAAGRAKHDHLIVTTDAGAVITYNDARRFGAMDLWPTTTLEAHPWLARLGPEPLGNAFSGAVLARALKGRVTSVKAALMDQRVVAGLGNIYVCEALWRAGIHPARMAGRIGRARVDRLARAIVETLNEAIAAGGSSLRDYRRADGELGYFQLTFRTYDRAGAPCPRAGCQGAIRRVVQAGRSSFYCPRCQR